MQFFPPVKAKTQPTTTETKTVTSEDVKRQQGFSALLSTKLATEGRDFSLSKNTHSAKPLGMVQVGTSASIDTDRSGRQPVNAMENKHNSVRTRSVSAPRQAVANAENNESMEDVSLLAEGGAHVSPRMSDDPVRSKDSGKSNANKSETGFAAENDPGAMSASPEQNSGVIVSPPSALAQEGWRKSPLRNERNQQNIRSVLEIPRDAASAQKKGPERNPSAGLEQGKGGIHASARQEARADARQRPAETGKDSASGAQYARLHRQREGVGQIAEFSKGSNTFDSQVKTQSNDMTTLHEVWSASEAGSQIGSDLFKMAGGAAAGPEAQEAGEQTGGDSVLHKSEAKSGAQTAPGQGAVSAGPAITLEAQEAGGQTGGESVLHKSEAKSGVQTIPGQGAVSAGPAIAAVAQQSRMQAGGKSREYMVGVGTGLRSVPVETGARAGSLKVVERSEPDGEFSKKSATNKPDMRSESQSMPGATEHRFMSAAKAASDDRTVYGSRVWPGAEFRDSRQHAAIADKDAWIASPMGTAHDSSSGVDQPQASASVHSPDWHSPQTEKLTSAERDVLMKDQQKGVNVSLQQHRPEAKAEVEPENAPNYRNASKEGVQLSAGQGARSDARLEPTAGARQNRSPRAVNEEIFAAPIQDASTRVRGTGEANSSVFGDENFGPLFQDRGGSPLQHYVQTGTRDRGAEVYRQVENGIFTNLGQGRKQLVIRLDPPDLGQIRVILQVRGNEVQAVLRTPDEDTSHALHEQLSQLRTQLESQGLKVTRLEVQTDAADSDTQSQWQGAGEHNRFQENRESAMTAGRMRILERASSGLVQDVQHPLHKEKSSPTGVDIFA